MSRMLELSRLITNIDAKKVCEVGVWAGETTFHILESCPNIDQYYMVDPLSYDTNCFEYSSDNEDFPRRMSNNTYACTMGQGIRQQEQLDEMYNNILSGVAKYHKVTFYREGSLDAVKHFENEELDLVFIDAIHLYEAVKKDIAAWLPKVRPGGILCGDDYTNDFPGVIKAVKEAFGEVYVQGAVWGIVK